MSRAGWLATLRTTRSIIGLGLEQTVPVNGKGGWKSKELGVQLDLAMLSESNAQRRRVRPGMRAFCGQPGVEPEPKRAGEMFGCPVCASRPMQLGLLRFPVGAPTEKRVGVLGVGDPRLPPLRAVGVQPELSVDDRGANSAYNPDKAPGVQFLRSDGGGQRRPVSDPRSKHKCVLCRVCNRVADPGLGPQFRPGPDFTAPQADCTGLQRDAGRFKQCDDSIPGWH